MAMTLGDAFNRRKKLAADLTAWTNRLQQAGKDTRSYRTKATEGTDAFTPEPGTERTTTRHYTIEECQARITQVLSEDQELALRISLTNQRAKAAIQDLDGVTRELSVPELLVLKNEIIPRMETVARAMPTRPDNVNVFAEGNSYIRHRQIKRVEKKKETLSEKGLKVEEIILEGYDVVETTDYGRPVREVYNEIDRIQEFAERVKQAINEANKVELVDL
jgi:hypothetical protein